jgi:hypothetical protein
MGDQSSSSAESPPPSTPPLSTKQSRWRKGISWVWNNTDSLTKWIQVVALIVAGYWAYTRFVRVDAPSLEPTGEMDVKVDQDETYPCDLKIRLTIKNTGHTPFDINGLTFNAWKVNAPHPSGNSPVYFSLNQMRLGEPLLQNFTPDDLTLIDHYPAGSANFQEFTFGFNKFEGSYLIEATANVHHSTLKTISGTYWSEWTCPSSVPQHKEGTTAHIPKRE